MADVFISYSRTDQEFVRALYNALDQRQLNAWVDWAGIPLSADWQDEIDAAIEGADTCVFVISPEFARSGPCKLEVDHAVACNKRLMPIVRRELPDADRVVHEALRQHNWLLFREGDDFEAAFDRLIAALQTDLA